MEFLQFFARLPFGQFSAENSKPWLDSSSFIKKNSRLKCLDFQSNQYKKLTPVLSRFCNGLWHLSPKYMTLLTVTGDLHIGEETGRFALTQCRFAPAVKLTRLK